MTGEAGAEEAPTSAGSALLASLAFLLIAAALLVPWWQVTNTLGGSSTAEMVGLWANTPLRHEGIQWVTVALAVAPLPLLFIRVAARSRVYEPQAWERDLVVAGGLSLLAALSCIAWPVEGPFWGSVSYPAGGDERLVVAHGPAAGWWLAILAAALLAVARWRAQRLRPG